MIQKSYFGNKVEIKSWQTSVVHNIPTDKRDSFLTLFFGSSADRRFEKLGTQLIEYLSKKCFISISTKYWGCNCSSSSAVPGPVDTKGQLNSE